MSEPLQKTGAVTAARRIVQLVHRVERTAWQVAAWSGASGLFLAVLLVGAARGSSAWLAAPAGLLAVAVLVPAAVLVLLAAGLRQLGRVPDRLFADVTGLARSLPTLTAAESGSAPKRLWSFVRFLLGSRAALAAARDRVLAAGLYLRVLHPAMLVAALVALAATAVLVPAAVVTAVVIALW